jgi:hypothetical protein
MKYLITLLLILILALLFFKFMPLKKTRTLKIGKTIVQVEIADTAEKQEEGLSGRESLGKREGMLFVYPKKDFYRFWMKGMKFNLDFIWIADSRVVDLTLNVPVENKPDTDLTIYTPKAPVDQLLEVNSGFVKKNNIKLQDKVETYP